MINPRYEGIIQEGYNMLTDRMFIHTKSFDKQWASLGCNDDDLSELQKAINELEGSQMNTMGERLIAAAQEALEHSEGKINLRTTRLPVAPVCETISPEEIRQTRENLKMSQSVFALVIGVSKKTIESWESGRYMPDGAARRLITIMQKDPDFPTKYEILQKAQ